MQQGNIWLVLNAFGSNIQKKDVTPAECQLLKEMFNREAGGDPVSQLTITGEAMAWTHAEMNEVDSTDKDGNTTTKPGAGHKRTSREEQARLVGKYGEGRIKAAFPGLNPVFPETFAEAGFGEGAEFVRPKEMPSPRRETFFAAGGATSDRAFLENNVLVVGDMSEVK